MKERRRAFLASCALLLITTLNILFLVCRDGHSFYESNEVTSLGMVKLEKFEIISLVNENESMTFKPFTGQVFIAFNFSAGSSLRTPLHYFPKPTKKLEMVVLVTSSATSLGAERRSGIRNTWHSKWHHHTHTLPTWGTYFLLGQSNNTDIMEKLYTEAEIYQDMIIGDFIDHFYNLSVKVMVGFEWVSEFAPFCSYILKLDDDVMPIIPNVFSFLYDKDTPQTRLYAGNVQFAAVPMRLGKYSIDRREFSRPFYPRYVSGGGMVLTPDVAKAMVAIFNMSDFFKIDDVFVGMLALRLGIDPYPGNDFRLSYPDQGPCTCVPETVVQHGFGDPKCMKTAYERTRFTDLTSKIKRFNSSLAWHRVRKADQ